MPNLYTYRSMTEADISDIAKLEPHIFPLDPYTEPRLRNYFDRKYSRVALDSNHSIIGYVFAKRNSNGLFIGNM